jgi:DNA polymerase-3 subunit delta
MQVTAQQLFKDLEQGHWKPLYLIAGEEPFQAGEIVHRLKAYFLKDPTDQEFNFESWDGEGLDAASLLGSLQTLPGLFGGDKNRLILCHRFEKAAPSQVELLDGYWRDPSPTTCLVLLCTKVDKRKGWYRAIDEHGQVIHVSEPYDREWPKWQAYFERKIQKKVDPGAWDILVQSSGRQLSLLWAELQKMVTYVGTRTRITAEEVLALTSSTGGADVFEFADDVLCRRAPAALRRYQRLLHSGENEVKILSILVRQFRLVEQCQQLMRKGIQDSKTISAQIGTAPYFLPKIQQQAAHHSPQQLSQTFHRLAETDFRMKTGESGLWEAFLVPYFSEKL